MKRKNGFWFSPVFAICLVYSPVCAHAQQNSVPSPPSPKIERLVPPHLDPDQRDAQRTISGPFRLIYTLTDMDGSRKVGSQHFEIVLDADGLKNNLNLGTKIPIETAAPGTGSPISQMQISYVDIGVNIYVRLRQFANGLELQSHVVQSAIDPQQSPLKIPIIRQALLDTTVLMNENKPIAIGNVNIPGTTHVLQIQVELNKLP